MTAKQLTDSILQLAIQGKLVPQDPNDEPASVLLDCIRKEKARLVKEGKLKKKDLVEMPISEEEIPFEIPESWEWCRLEDISRILGGFAFKSHEYTNKGSRVIRISDISEEGFVNKNIVRHPYVDSLSQYSICKFDILMAMTGGTVGKSLFVKDLPEEKMLLNQRVALIRCKEMCVDYIDIVIKSYYIQKIISDSKNSTNDNISMADICNFLIPLPPLAEQHRIVQKIEEYMPIIKEYGEAYNEASKMDAELPERLKKSILQEAIMGKLGTQDPNDEPASVLLDRIRKEKARLVKEGKLKKKDLVETPISEEEIPFQIPESWQWVRLSDTVKVVMGQSPDGNDVFESSESVDAFEFHQGKIYFTDKYIAPSGKWCKSPSRIAEIDSLLVCVRAPIGDVNITQREIGIGRGLACIKGYDEISTAFLFFWMKAHKRNLVEQGTGSTFKAISVDVLKDLPIPLPPLAEQHRIVEKIEELYAEIDNMTIKNKVIDTKETETKEVENE